jgi:hypothetical protein
LNKVIVSQNGRQLVIVGPGQVFNLGTLADGRFSIGLSNMGLAAYESEDSAKWVLEELALFLVSSNSYDTIFKLRLDV